MPLFEFQCRRCGHHFETLTFSTSRTTPTCPACESQDLEKLYSVFGVGSGSASGRRSSPAVAVGGG